MIEIWILVKLLKVVAVWSNIMFIEYILYILNLIIVIII